MFEAMICQKNPDRSTSCSPTTTADIILSWKLKKIVIHWKMSLEEGKQIGVAKCFFYNSTDLSVLRLLSK